MHKQTVEIVRMMCAGIKWNFGKALEILKMPVLEAAKLGIYEIVNEIMKVYYSSLCFVDEDGNNLCMLAVLYRREKLFKLLRQMRGAKVIFVKQPGQIFKQHLALSRTVSAFKWSRWCSIADAAGDAMVQGDEYNIKD